MAPSAQLLPGNLDLLILKAISLGDVHGYGVLLRIEQISGRAILVQQGVLYPALYRLERRGLIAGRWDTSANNRRARFYQLTALGRRQFAQEQKGWQHLVDAIARSLTATPQEI
ncbi:MAG: transcriptional regulator, PadR family [Geminicoccaceae bacterium]|jgi:transcriptional regulator|nr:transcriptional regulator, PadR family [Geminicoccaceae bacterium]